MIGKGAVATVVIGSRDYPPGDGYISHQTGKGKSLTQNAILGGYVGFLEITLYGLTLMGFHTPEVSASFWDDGWAPFD